MPEFLLHQRLQSLGSGLYRRWGREGRWNHSRGIDLFGTWAARAASRFFPDILWRVTPSSAARFDLEPPAAKTAYLTIDDGPTPGGTPRLLEVLSQFNVYATMFLVGRNARQNRSLVRDLISAGHSLANHTETHLDPWTSDFRQISDELARTDDVLSEELGHIPRWVRPPQGHFTARMRSWCIDRAQAIAMWDVLPADFSPNVSQERVVSFTLRHLRPGSVLVLHDNERTVGRTPEALAELLPRLLDEGWTFARL